ncbi:MAG: hypothetical protein KA140_03125 [Caldisericia bacterium]|nr:hypothetical protein [Caldisericia bacterium]
MTKNIKIGTIILSFLYLSCALGSNLPIVSSNDSKTKGYIIENKSKYTMKLEYLDYRNKRDVAPGSKYVINSNENPLRVSWKLQIPGEPFFENHTYGYLLSKTNNKLTVSDHNSGLNGYPWTITKKANASDCTINVKANVECECLIYRRAIFIKRISLPDSVTLEVKDILDKTIIFSYKYKDNYYTVNLSFPKQFKGGMYELSFNLNTDPTIKANMANDDKKTMTLDGCVGFAGFSVGHALMLKKNVAYFPSNYSGVFDVKSCLFDKRLLKELKATKAISPEFSYKINYSTQNQTPWVIPLYCYEETDSQDTAVNLGNFFPDNFTLDVIKVKSEGNVFVARNVKSWSTEDNTGEYMVRPTKSMNFIKIENKKTYTLHIVSNDHKKDEYIYDTKGLQYFTDANYYLSGLFVYQSEQKPFKIISGKGYIDIESIAKDLGSTNYADINGVASFDLKMSGKDKLLHITIDKNVTNKIVVDNNYFDLDANIVVSDSKLYIPLKTFVTIIDAKMKWYPKTKSVCLSYKY